MTEEQVRGYAGGSAAGQPFLPGTQDENWVVPDEIGFPDSSARELQIPWPPAPEVPPAPIENPVPVARRSVAVLIPALNEEHGIGKVLRGIPTRAMAQAGFAIHPIVVDGRSTDRTTELARALGASVFTQQMPGKGSAVREIIPELKYDYAIMIDADGSYPTEAIPDILRLLEEGHDVVSGSRLAGEMAPGAMARFHRMGNQALTMLANLLYPTSRTTDVCTGLWGFRVEALKEFRLTANRFELEADFYTESALRGHRYAEIPIRYAPRAGTAKLNWMDGIRIAQILLMKRLHRSPPRASPAPDSSQAHPASGAAD